MTVLGVIPARWASQRFPGKPLAPLAGRPLIEHVWRRARDASTLGELVVATDDNRIADAVHAFGGVAIMTPADCPSGTDRAAHVARRFPQADLVVNVQGDEPLLDAGVIDAAVNALRETPWAGVATAVTPIHGQASFESPHVVKAVVGTGGRALYFSRSPIPSRVRTPPAPGEAWGLKHLGLYVFRRETLLAFASQPPAPLEQIEKLEQLRFLAGGVGIVAVETSRDAVGVDTPEELAEAERLLVREGQSR
ncbi:MAG: 3-deoxy-manno-octulosonate cytidylyltransferase [Candidatus Sumerlaeia bacterium]|nr:3-deoxy-manno-octulosonate cytidylyltransferase [Candidatus Sumerlaeia bacterium]